jgi:hypothetical protein
MASGSTGGARWESVFLCAVDLFYTPHKSQPLRKIENLKLERKDLQSPILSFLSQALTLVTTGFAKEEYRSTS